MTYDITGDVGPLFPSRNPPKIPMYSFDTPAYKLWNAIGRTLKEQGWTDDQIAAWLRSSFTRHALDGSLGTAIEHLGEAFAATLGEPPRA